MSTSNLSLSGVDPLLEEVEDEKVEIGNQSTAPTELSQEVRKLVEQIRQNENDPGKCYSPLSRLRSMYYDKKTRCYRSSIAEVLSECGFPDCTYKLMSIMKERGYYPEGFNLVKNPLMWKTSRYILDNAWNYSDCSDEFARELAKANVVEVLLGNLKQYPNKDPDKKSNQYFIIQATLCIICNIARRPQNKAMFKKYTPSPSKIVFEFRFSKDNYLKVLALSTLAYIVDEKEAKKVTEDPDAIRTIIHWMGISVVMDNFHRIKEGFTASELAYALEKLAIDGNVMRIIEGNALKVLYRMLGSSDIPQQVNAAKCIWTLAFNKEARKAIKEYTNMVQTLLRLKKEETNKELVQNVGGALWVLDEKIDDEPELVDPGQPKHLFISYCWNEQETVKRIWQGLRERGYDVWIDLERMSGDILEAMSSAVERSSIVIICVSEGYKQSQCCRTEAGYTYKRKKGFIPLFMQKPYNPDGWLGALLSSKLYFDFSGSNRVEFDDSMNRLLRELNAQGVLNPKSPITPEIPKECGSVSLKRPLPNPKTRSTECIHPESTPSTPTDSDSVFADQEPHASHSPIDIRNPPNANWEVQPVTKNLCTTIISRSSNSILAVPPRRPDSFTRMKKSDIRNWLKDNDLENHMQSFKQMDGKLLWQLNCVKAEAPNFFYKILSEDMELDAIAILKFRQALETIKESD